MLVRSLLLGGAVALLLLQGQSFLVGNPGLLVDPYTLGDVLRREIGSRVDVSWLFDAVAAAIWVGLFLAITLAVSVAWPVVERLAKASAATITTRR